MSGTLHVTNGDSVVYAWRKGGLAGTHLPWRDVLHCGPVPGGLSLEETSRVRALYLGGAGHGNPIKLQRDFAKRDAAIARFAEYDDVVLWFEHDLYDQLQLLQILHYLGSRGAAGNVHLIQTDTYLGMLAPEELLPLQHKRRPVNAATFALAGRIWDAFREPSPEALVALRHAAGTEMRHLGAALGRLFEEFPAPANGLSRTQRQALRAIDDGARRADEIFRLAQLDEEAAFFGDTAFVAVLDDLAREPAPLLAADGHRYTLTALGTSVLRGQCDWLEMRPADHWIGGVHVSGDSPWRWDATAGRFLSPNPQ